MKRVLATLLCATLVFSSGGFSTTAYAEEIAPAQAIVSESEAEAGQSQEALEASQEVSSEIESPSEDVKENEDASEASSEAADEASEAATDEAAEDASEASSDEEIDEDAADAFSTEISDEDASDELIDDATESASAEASLTEKAEGEEDGESKLMYSTASGSACFTVDADGKLILKEGISLPTNAVIPKEAKTIPVGIFDGSTGCTSVKFEKDSQAVEIEAGAFKSSSIVSVEIPAGVTEIKANTFMDCEKLNTVYMEDGVSLTSVGEAAFQNTAITSFSSYTLTNVGASAFSGCRSLKNVNIPKVETIGNYAFNGCSVLSSSMNFSGTIKSIGNYAFISCGFTSLDLSKLSYDVTFGESCFQENSKLTEVTLPDGLETIPKKMFYKCTALTGLVVGSGTRVIEVSAFESCTALTTVILPNAYIIKNKAFGSCNKISVIEIMHNNQAEKAEIAEDAFPDKKGVTLKGYDSEVEVVTYAQNKGYTFVSLSKRYDMSISLNKKGTAKVEPENGKYAAGTVVKLKVTPASGQVIKNVSITEDAVIKVEPVEITDKYQVFAFTMKEADAKVKVEMMEKSEAAKGKLDYILKPVNDYSPDIDKDGVVKFDISGRECQMVVTADGSETKSWLWNFTSSSSKVVTVSSTGVIRTAGQGKATITATLKTDSTKKVSATVQVAGDGAVNHITLKVPSNAQMYNIGGKRGTDEIIDGKTVPVIEFEKRIIANTAKSFDVSIEASDKYDQLLAVTSKWVSADTGIATVTKASSTDNKNTVNIKKGATGETLITVSVLNKGDKEAASSNTQSFIVRVVDGTPRLDNSTLTVDSYSKYGTVLDVVTVYGYTIEANNLRVSVKKKDGTYTDSEDLLVEWDGENYHIFSSHPDKPFAKTYSGATQLYLTGYISQTKKQFEIPITKLTVTNTALNPTVKTTGKINLFYNTLAPSELSGKATVTQSLSKLKVDKVQLVSAANFKKAGSEVPDSFAENFDVTKVSNTSFEITRSANEMVKVSGKNVTAGYIYIYYEGYANPVKKAVSVPVVDTAPAYVLNMTGATASTHLSDQEYPLQLLDKKTKAVIDLSELEADGLDFVTGTSYGLFKEFDDPDIAYAKANDVINLKVDGEPANGKAVIYVKMASWSKALTFTFTLKASSAVPAVKLDKTAVTLNKTYNKKGIVISGAISQANVDGELTGFTPVTYKATTKNADSYVALAGAINPAGNTLEITLPATDVAKGTYNFTTQPLITFDPTDDPIPGKALTFKVTVTETKPSVKLKSATFKLNADTSQDLGIEEATTTYTIGNLPTGVEGTVVPGSYSFVPAAAGTPAIDDIAEIEFAYGTATATLKDTKTVRNYAGKTLKYKVSGLQVDCGGDTATAPDFNISIQLVNKAPTVSAKVTGTLNPVDKASKIAVTATVTNSSSDIEKIGFYELDSYGRICKDDDKKPYSPHFELVWEGGKVAYIKVKDGATVAHNTKYTVALEYKLASAKRENSAIYLNVTPKQTIPQIKTDKTSATMYAGTAYVNRYVDIKITVKDAKFDVNMLEPEFASGTSASIKKAFKIEDFDADTGIVRIRLENPSALVLNKTYTLNLVTRYEHQADKTTGNKFTLKVTVKK